jgi:adenylate cyclase
MSVDPPRSFELTSDITLGRDAACTIVLQDPLVSRMHAEIRRTADGFAVFDLGSTHGTFVGGERVREKPLADGMEILLGATRLRFESPMARFQTGGALLGDTQAQALARRTTVSEEKFLPLDALKSDADVRSHYEHLFAAYQLMRGIGVEDDLDGVLERVVACAFQLLAADRAAILLLDANGQPKPRLAKRRDGAAAEDMVLSQTMVGEVLATKTGVLLLDAGRDKRFASAKSVVAEGIRSAMCVPMIHGGEMVGVMHLDSLMATNVFQERDLELFTSIAGQAALVVKNTLLRAQLQGEAKTRVYLQRFLSPGVVDQVVGGKFQLGHGGELREVTVLFSDIRGFTAMSESAQNPQVIVGLLNDYFERMVDVLFRHRGTLDKYVGDALMALFGVPLPMPDAPLAAVACALEMQRMVDAFNAERVAAGAFPIHIGIGIHTGPALCGTIGSRKAMQYTAIGDTVNTCSRLCSVAAAGQIIVSEQTMARIAASAEAEALPPVHVKGKAEPLNIFAVRALRAAVGGGKPTLIQG